MFMALSGHDHKLIEIGPTRRDARQNAIAALGDDYIAAHDIQVVPMTARLYQEMLNRGYFDVGWRIVAGKADLADAADEWWHTD
jgi:hypothetical protein